MNAEICDDPFPRGVRLACIKKPDHEGPHATALGAHQHVDERGFPTGELEYEFAEWPQSDDQPETA